MSCSRSLRRSLARASLVVFSLLPGAAWGQNECVQGPIPENADNRVGLCSPVPADVAVEIVPEGLQLSWDAPPRASTAYVSPVQAVKWVGVDSATVVPTVQLTGTYLSFRDRRIELSVTTINDSLGGVPADSLGFVGRFSITVAWTSIYEASSTGAIGGKLEVPRGYSGQKLRFEVPNSNPAFPADTTALAGLRVAFRVGGAMKLQNSAVFDVEDFEGWHVWRWGADPDFTELPRRRRIQQARRRGGAGKLLAGALRRHPAPGVRGSQCLRWLLVPLCDHQL